MREIKKFISTLLVIAILLTSADYTTLVVLAADGATDAYDAYTELWRVRESNQGTNNGKPTEMSGIVSTGVRTPLNDVTNNVTGATTWSYPSSVVNGVKQLGVDAKAYAQVKSGDYNNASNYEAMSGTPTTENLFVNYGGNTWMVQLQYRYFKQDYDREYNFTVQDTPNYRYYKVGDVPAGDVIPTIEFNSNLVIDNTLAVDTNDYSNNPTHPNQKPTMYLRAGDVDTLNYERLCYAWVQNEYDFNYDSTNPGNTPDYNKDNPDSGSTDWQKARIWNNNVSGNLWDLGYNTSNMKTVASNSSSNPSTYMKPGPLTATVWKQHAASVILNLQQMWNEQDDNYRADQGLAWQDINPDPTVDEEEPVLISWQYTYGWQARHGSVYGRDSYSNGFVPADESIASREASKHNSIWNPLWISYQLDWDAPTNPDGSVNPQTVAGYYVPYTLSDLGYGKRDVKSYVKLLLKGEAQIGDNTVPEFDFITIANPSGGDINFSSGSMLWMLANNQVYDNGVDCELGSYGETARLYDYLQSKNITDVGAYAMGAFQFCTTDYKVNQFGSDHAVEADDYLFFIGDNAKRFVAFDYLYNADNGFMDVETSNVRADDGFYDVVCQGINKKFDSVSIGNQSASLVEGPALFYKQAYSYYFLLAPFLYYDELQYLFQDLPGAVPTLAEVGCSTEAEYNAKVERNLYAAFGQFMYPNGDNDKIKESISMPGIPHDMLTTSFLTDSIKLVLPLSCYPMGGDMDGNMNDTWSSFYAPLDTEITGLNKNVPHTNKVYTPGIHEDYVFYISSSFDIDIERHQDGTSLEHGSTCNTGDDSIYDGEHKVRYYTFVNRFCYTDMNHGDVKFDCDHITHDEADHYANATDDKCERCGCTSSEEHRYYMEQFLAGGEHYTEHSTSGDEHYAFGKLDGEVMYWVTNITVPDASCGNHSNHGHLDTCTEEVQCPCPNNNHVPGCGYEAPYCDPDCLNGHSKAGCDKLDEIVNGTANSTYEINHLDSIEEYHFAWDIDEVSSHRKDVIFDQGFINISSSYSSDKDANQWCEDIKTMSFAPVKLVQRFHDVEWLDITSVNLWRLDHASAHGLARILATPMSANKELSNIEYAGNLDDLSVNELSIVTKAITSMGFEIYDIDDTVSDTASAVESNGYYSTANPVKSLEYYGRVANSFSMGSKSNADLSANNTYDIIGRIKGRIDGSFLMYSNADAGSTALANSERTSLRVRVSDCPTLIPSGSNVWVNDDDAAFLFKPNESFKTDSKDCLTFRYTPSAQGGRSHSTFYGFIAQAFAHTLYYKEIQSNTNMWEYTGLSGDRSSKSVHGYANSLLVQGDYLTIKVPNAGTEDSMTLAGYYYDTWDELGFDETDSRNNDSAVRIDTGTTEGNRILNGNVYSTGKYGLYSNPMYESKYGKFALATDSNSQVFAENGTYNQLSDYFSIAFWVPGQLSHLRGRGLSDAVYLRYDYADIKKLHQNLTIHSYCTSINGAAISPWDTYCLDNVKSNGMLSHVFGTDFDDMPAITERYQHVVYKLSDANTSFNKTSDLGSVSADDYVFNNNNFSANDGVAYLAPTTDKNQSGQCLTLPTNPSEADAKVLDLIWSAVSTDYSGGNDTTWTDRTFVRDVYLKPDALSDNFNTESIMTLREVILPIVGYQENGRSTFMIKPITSEDSVNKLQKGLNLYTHTLFKSDEVPIKIPSTTFFKSFNQFNIATKFAGTKDANGDITLNNLAPYYGNDSKNCHGERNKHLFDNSHKAYTVEVTGQVSSNDGYHGETNEFGGKFSKYYPWLAELTTDRFLSNGATDTGIGTLDYKLVHSKTQFLPTVNSTVDNRVNVSLHTQYALKPNTYTLNDVVIYNPVATESTFVKKSSEYLPDGSNTGSTGYLTSFNFASNSSFNVLRDMRTARANKSVAGNFEVITTAGGIISTIVQETPYTYFKLRAESQVDDKCFEIKSSSEDSFFVDMDLTDASKSSFTAERSGTYRLVIVEDSKQYSFNVYLNSGETVYWNGSAMFKSAGTTNFVQNYEAYVKAYNSISSTPADVNTESLHFPSGTTMNFLAGTLDMPEGSVFTLTLPCQYVLPFEVPSDSIAYHVEEISGSVIYYFEALEDTQLNNLTVKLNQDIDIRKFEGNAIETKDILLVSIEDSDQPVVSTTYIDYMFGTYDYSISSEKQQSCYNKSSVIVSGSSHCYGVETYESKHAYMCFLDISSKFSLEISDPHMVPSTDWRYYVLGWKTSDGDIIVDINDERLKDYEGNNTFLIPPVSNLTEDIKIPVTTMIADAINGDLYVGKLDGKYYLFKSFEQFNGFDITTVQCLKEWYGITMEDIWFDPIHFGDKPASSIATCLPDYNDIIWTSERHGYVGNSYACLFKATNVNYLAYSVKWSQNLSHRYSQSSSVWSYDWEKVTVKKTVGGAITETGEINSTNVISLDDEFLLYWDNYTDLASVEINPTDGYSDIQTNIGRGYDPIRLTDNKSDEYLARGLEYFKYDNVNVPTITNTDRWIRAKYVTFNTDMYFFATDEDMSSIGMSGQTWVDLASLGSYSSEQTILNPTTPAYDNSGNPNNIVYVKAGTKVYLGYYTTTKDDDHSGRFVDFGDDAKTKSPTGSKYTYHFWCPLGVSEADSSVVATCHVEAINAGRGMYLENEYEDSYNASAYRLAAYHNAYIGTFKVYNYFNSISPIGLLRNLKTDVLHNAELDQWGEYDYYADTLRLGNNVNIVTNWSTGYDDDSKMERISISTGIPVNNRYGNSKNSLTLSVIGRVGALTVVDTTDVALLDTFKIATEDEPYVVAGYIRSISKYDSSDSLKSTGQQFVYTTDNMDVRGRYMKGFRGEDYNNAMGVSFNTYNTQHFKIYKELEHELRFWKYSVHGTLLRRRLGLTASELYVGANGEKYVPDVSYLGTEVFCSLETIGNYFGSRAIRYNQSDEDMSNGSGDYGQNKIQIQVLYTDSQGNPLDVYLRENGQYYLINSGSMFMSEKEAKKYFVESGKSGVYTAYNEYTAPYVSEAVYNSVTEVTIATNSGGKDSNLQTYLLDQNMERREVTHSESKVTYDMVTEYNSQDTVVPYSNLRRLDKMISTTLLDQIGESNELGGSWLDYTYSYGSSQMLFLREFNRTFIGGATGALASKDSGTDIANRAKVYAQKWYFSIKLPTNVIFVPHGTKLTGSNEKQYATAYETVTSWVRVYSIGDTWVLKYDSSSKDGNYDKTSDDGSYNFAIPTPKNTPTPIPVYVFRPTGSSNFSDRGNY